MRPAAHSALSCLRRSSLLDMRHPSGVNPPRRGAHDFRATLRYSPERLLRLTRFSGSISPATASIFPGLPGHRAALMGRSSCFWGSNSSESRGIALSPGYADLGESGKAAQPSEAGMADLVTKIVDCVRVRDQNIIASYPPILRTHSRAVIPAPARETDRRCERKSCSPRSCLPAICGGHIRDPGPLSPHRNLP